MIKIEKIIFLCLMLVVFSEGKTIQLPFNASTFVYVEPDDIIRIEDYPSQWGYSRIVLGVQASGPESLNGTLNRELCHYAMQGYYQQLFFRYDGEAVVLKYMGHKSTSLTLQWWLDYAVETSYCEEPSVSEAELANFRDAVDIAFSAYMDLGSMNAVSEFETSSQMLKVSDYPNWMHNSILIQLESRDGSPLDGYVYIGGETLKITGYSVIVPLSRRSFLPLTLQVSFPTRRKFSVKWWAEYRNVQEIPVQKEEIKNNNRDSIFCKYNFTIAKRKKLLLKFSADDFSDGKTPTYTAKSALEGTALGLVENALYVGTVYDIHANLSSDKKITLALPLEIDGKVDPKDVVIYHEKGGVVEKIMVDSIENGFVYFQTNSFSSFISVIVGGAKKIGSGVSYVRNQLRGAVVDGGATLVGWFADGVQYVVDKVEKFYEWIENGVCNLFDPDAWKNLFSVDLEGNSTNDWNLPEGKMTSKDVIATFAYYQTGEITTGAAKQLWEINDNMDDVERLENTKNNLDIMLFELINRKVNSQIEPRFSIENMVTLVDATGPSRYIKNYMAVSTDLTKYAVEMTRMIKDCYGALNANTLSTFVDETMNLLSGQSSGEQVCRDIFENFGWREQSYNVVDCSMEGIQMLTQYVKDGSDVSTLIKRRDDIVLAASEVLARVAMLAYYDKTMREHLKTWFNQTYKSLSAMMEFMGPLMLYNNISIKAEAAMALYEYVYWGTTNHFERLLKGIEIHYGEEGGFSEGMGYLQYINEDVPYLMVAMKMAFFQSGRSFEVPKKFYRSGYYLMNLSRNIRWTSRYDSTASILIPVEVDDGCTSTPEFSVWGTLTGDKAFFEKVSTTSIDSTNKLFKSPLVLLGLPEEYDISVEKNLSGEKELTGAFMDGTAIINYHEGDDDYTITLVGENGKMWENGQAHDQQDNMTFTLSSTRDGHIVRDVGYSGFDDDSRTRGYKNHNVLMRPNYPEWTDGVGNKSLTYRDLSNRAEEYFQEVTGFGTKFLFLLSSGFLADFSVVGSGGSEAFLSDSVNAENLKGYTLYQKTLGRSLRNPLTNELIYVSSFNDYRSIVYFGKALWLIDQPSDDELRWVVNGSAEHSEIQGSFFDEKVDVYVGDNKVNHLESWEQIGVQQNGRRLDYSAGEIIFVNRQYIDLPNWKNLTQNGSVTPITMIYPIDTMNTFKMVPLMNISKVQCFERTDGNVLQRVVIPAVGVTYMKKDVLTDIPTSDYSSYNGIMFAKKVGDGAWEVRVLNDGGNMNGNFKKINYLPSIMLLR